MPAAPPLDREDAQGGKRSRRDKAFHCIGDRECTIGKSRAPTSSQDATPHEHIDTKKSVSSESEASSRSLSLRDDSIHTMIGQENFEHLTNVEISNRYRVKLREEYKLGSSDARKVRTQSH